MNLGGQLGLQPEHRRLVRGILRANLPPGATAWVFGSRATGCARRYSDLDLAVDVGRRLTLDELEILGEAFAESDLPFKVDLVGWQAISDGFRATIAAERIAFELEGREPDSDPRR